MTPARPSRSLRIPLWILAGSLGLAAWSRIGLALDGSYQWFGVVESGYPYAVNNRAIHLVLQSLPALASHFIHNPVIISRLFTLTFLLPPLIGIILSWWVVRRRGPGLMLWSIGGVLLAVLPGQIDVVAEANIALQIAWPLFLIALLGVRRADLPMVITLAAAVILTHPISVGLLALAAGLALFGGLIHRGSLWLNAITAALLIGAAAINALRLANSLTRYETSTLSIRTLSDHYEPGLAGEPLLFIALAWAALGLILWREIRQPEIPSQRNLNICVALLLVGGVALCVRASLPVRWAGIISYHFYTLLAALPFLAMAAIDVYRWRRGSHDLQFTAERRIVAGTAVLVTAAVMATHAISWQGFVADVQQSMMKPAGVCLSVVETPELALGRETVLEYWSATALSIWLQDGPPTRLIVSEPLCADQSFARGFWLTPWERYQWGDRWFDLRPLGEALTQEQIP